MKLILMRGVSGSGKSTLARELAGKHEGAVVLSTDDYFMVEGVYAFDPRMLGENHRRNQERAAESMRAKTPCVIIDNTNTQAWEMKPYVLAALELGYEVEIHESQEVGLEELMRRQFDRSDKTVSEETVRRMLERYEKDVDVQKILDSKNPFLE